MPAFFQPLQRPQEAIPGGRLLPAWWPAGHACPHPLRGMDLAQALGGGSPASTLNPEVSRILNPSVTLVRGETRLITFVEMATQSQLDGILEYKTTRGQPYGEVLWRLMAHVVNHGTQHRGEAAALLTGMGHSPGDIDLLFFLRENGYLRC